ncbi:MAG: NAD(P)-dependent alcohol dehydrogenase [Pseudomonadota bacterium]
MRDLQATTTCRALRFPSWGGPEVLRIETVTAPLPRPGEVRLRTLAAALNPKDVMVRKGRFRAASGRPPIVPGFDICGEVVARGPGVQEPAIGDRVFAMLPGMRGGAMSELVTLTAGRTARVPAGLDDTTAAATPLAALTALQALRNLGRVEHGRSVVINGASGGVGTFAIQIAALLGAQVTTLSSDRNRELCRQLGAHQALDYADREALGELEFDVFFDVFGNRRMRQIRKWLAPDGVYITTVPSARAVVSHLATSVSLGRRSRLVVVRHDDQDLAWIVARLAEQRLHPVVDQVYPWTEAQAAYRQLETKHARGKIVLSFTDAPGISP